jgi:hypothetical protein
VQVPLSREQCFLSESGQSARTFEIIIWHSDFKIQVSVVLKLTSDSSMSKKIGLEFTYGVALCTLEVGLEQAVLNAAAESP